MYHKHGCVLRVETVINRPYEFQVRRRGVRNGMRVVGCFPMAKGVSNLCRYAEVSRSANEPYLDALAAVDDTTEARRELRAVSEPKRVDGRSYRGFNPAASDEIPRSRRRRVTREGQRIMSAALDVHERRFLDALQKTCSKSAEICVIRGSFLP